MLRVDNLLYQYNTQKILKGVSFHLAHHQIGLLVGQNGAGKSTLLRCTAGWTTVDTGTIAVQAVSIQAQDRAFRKQVVFVPDTPDFFDELTVWEHLQFIAQLHGVRGWQAHAEQLLGQFQISDYRDAFPFILSRGMRYKLALCGAFLVQPPLLLLDEPFGPLDAHAAQILWQTLSHYRASHGSVLFSSHTIPENVNPDVVLYLHDGLIDLIDHKADIDLAKLFGHVD